MTDFAQKKPNCYAPGDVLDPSGFWPEILEHRCPVHGYQTSLDTCDFLANTGRWKGCVGQLAISCCRQMLREDRERDAAHWLSSARHYFRVQAALDTLEDL